jgi:pilus assembly protein Flp/PilA
MIFFRRSFWRRLAQDTRGATGIEYGLIASLVSMAALTGFDTLGESLLAKFENVESRVESVNSN